MKWLKDIFKERISVKRLIIYALLLLAVIFPTVLALIYASYVGDGIAIASDIHSVVLKDAEGNELFSEERTYNSSHDSLVGIFNSLYANMTPMDGNVTDNTRPLIVDISSKMQKTTLTCYFTFTEGASFAVDKSGAFYSIAAKDSEKFLASPYAESLYSEAIPPSLMTADGDTVTPASVMWKYRTTDGELLPSSQTKHLSIADTYGVAESISLSFSTPPDRCTAEVFHDGKNIFTGDLHSLSYLTLDNISSVRVICNGVWEERSDRAFCGSISYDFQVSVHTRAEFLLDRTTLRQGEFALLKATHISNPSRLSFHAENSRFSPVFNFIGDTAYAVIPYTAMGDSDKLSFTVYYGVSTQSFILTSQAGGATFNEGLKKSLLAKGDDISVDLPRSERMFFITDGALPNSDSFENRLSFGDNSNTASAIYYSEYVCSSGYGLSCEAIMSGRVAEVGSSEELGNYVIVDVGFGIRVWYCRLSVTDVFAGEYVATGDVIGKSGSLTDGKESGFRLMMSYGDVFLDPDFIVERKG